MECVIVLFLEIVGGEVGFVVEVVVIDKLLKVIEVCLCCECLDCVIGYYIDDVKVIDILMCLGLDVKIVDGVWSVDVFSYCFDICIEEDLIEEVVCVYGYNSILNVVLIVKLKMINYDELYVVVIKFCNMFVICGY